GHDALVALEQPRVLARDPRQELWPAPRDEQVHQPPRLVAYASGEQLARELPTRRERHRRVLDDARDPLVGEDRGGRVQVLAPRVELTVAQGDLERGLCVPSRGRDRSGHQLFEPPSPDVDSLRKSWTRRRWRG